MSSVKFLPLIYHNNNFSFIRNNILYHIILERFTKNKYDYLNIEKREKFIINFIKKSKSITYFNFIKYKNKYDFLKNIEYKNLFELPKNSFYIEHHFAHAYTGLFQIEYKNDYDILIWDGVGEKYTTVFFDKNGDLFNIDIPIGQLWNQITQLSFGCCNEGKLMGLSAYGEFNKKYYDLFQKIKKIKFQPYNYSKLYEDFKENILIYIYDDIKNFNKLKDIAYTLQFFTNEIFIEIINKFKSTNKLIISGGGAYNGYVNTLMYNFYDYVYIPPQPGDEGLSVGLSLKYIYDNNIELKNKNYAFLGLEKNKIKKDIFKNYKIYEFHNEDDLINEITTLLKNGKIIAIFNNKSESGKRALGNRSIIANPIYPNIKNILNKVKHREKWRPFGITILEKKRNILFNKVKESPHMSFIEKSKINYKEILHFDGTIRLQTIEKNFNTFFYHIIENFYKKTNVPFLINTSLNLAGKPLIENLIDLKEFKNENKDIILIINKKYLVV